MIRYEGLPKNYWLEKRWGSLRLNPHQELPDKWTEGSGSKFSFICSCSRICVISMYTVKNSISCGKCSFKPKEYWLTQTWGSLKLDSSQELTREWGPSSSKRLRFICDCGKSVNSVFYKIPKSCGKCSFKPKEYWLSKKWGELRLDSNQELPNEWGPSTNKKMKFLCSCGGSTNTSFENVNVSGHTKSCGHCEDRSKGYWLNQVWGKLNLDPSQPLRDKWSEGVPNKLVFICTCGKKVETVFSNVTYSKTSSCGKCNFKSKEYWLSKKWGKLKLDPSQELPDKEWAHWTETKFKFNCECGRTIKKPFGGIYGDNYRSCGMCEWKPISYWISWKWGKLQLDPNQVFPQEEWGVGLKPKLKFNCDCGRGKNISLSEVLRGYVKSCGCLDTGKSVNSEAYQLYEYIKLRAPDAEFSYWHKTLEGRRREYDIYISSKKIAIEYHGLRWHLEHKAGKKDYEKYLSAKNMGVRLIQIYSDEWKSKSDIVKAKINNLLKYRPKNRANPKFKITPYTSEEAKEFLNKFHYLGETFGLTVEAHHSSKLVGVWVFTIEKDKVIWNRACTDSNYRMWNPHQKALNLAIKGLKPLGVKEIIAYSDNRLHTGKLYENLEFTLKETLEPDFSYSDGNIRKFKDSYKDDDIASQAGFYRIWNSGKKLFTLSLS